MKLPLATLLLLASACSTSRSPEYKVTYDVAGDDYAKHASITYSNESGGTEQKDQVSLPWTKTFTAKPGDRLYISAQNRSASGSISTYITINGNPVKTSTSQGAYVIATSSTQCCN